MLEKVYYSLPRGWCWRMEINQNHQIQGEVLTISPFGIQRSPEGKMSQREREVGNAVCQAVL